MSLIAIASPPSESALCVMLCTLEAHGIPAFVQGGGFGALYPGPQIAAYNARRILVADVHEARAREALQVFAQLSTSELSPPPNALDRLRVIAEVILFGWFVPGRRGRAWRSECDD